MTCEFAVDGLCQISTQMAGIPVPLHDGACRACLAIPDAKLPGSHVVTDRACYALRLAGQKDKAAALRLASSVAGAPQGRKVPQSRSAAKRIEAFHALWSELHAYGPEHAEGWDEASARKRYVSWLSRVPSIGCRCNQHWKNITRRLPPDFSSGEAFYQWSIDAHNEVNKLLGKPIWNPTSAKTTSPQEKT